MKKVSKKSKKFNNKKRHTREITVIKECERVEEILNEAIEETKKINFFKDTFLRNLVFVTTIIFLIEILFRAISNFEIIGYASLRIFLSVFLLSFIITFLASLTKRKWVRNTILLSFIFIYTIYTWLQLGFINYLGVYISFNTSSQLGAVADYTKDFLESFKLVYYVIFTPFIASLIWYLIIDIKREYNKLNLNLKHLLFIPMLCIICFGYYLTLKVPFMQNEFQIKSNEKLFKNPDVPTVAVNQFGTTVFGVLDLKSYLMPTDSTSNKIKIEIEEVDTNRKVLPVLENLAKTETNNKYINLNNYFVSQSITDYNDYTGMFEGKNVVVILLESVNEAIINEEYYPNFTKLYNEGWSWKNSYSPRNSCATGNNEFSALTGLYSIYNTCTANVYKNNKYFEAIFNLFNDKGYRTNSMHNFTEWYYYRSTIHPNMGSGKYYGSKDLDIKTANYYGEWPNDVEFFEKAFNIILNDESDKPFMTWLTTVSSHQPYSSPSETGDMYKDFFVKEGYSKPVARYMSKLKIVDEAIGVMVEKLTEANKLDDTVIVMLADHYPYGLKQSYIKEMIDHDLSDYDIEKTPFVIYNPSMKEEVYEDYNSYVNLVPTLANLMGLDYDPRLYMGKDLLSDSYESRVVFADGSWKNEIAYYNASTSKLKYYKEETYTTEEVQRINSEIGLQIQMSSQAIRNNYFEYLKKHIDEYKLEQEKIKEEEKLAKANKKK